MIMWMLINWQSMLIGSILLLGFIVAVRKMIADKKAGKGCGCGCEGCALSSQCHGEKKDEENQTEE